MGKRTKELVFIRNSVSILQDKKNSANDGGDGCTT